MLTTHQNWWQCVCVFWDLIWVIKQTYGKNFVSCRWALLKLRHTVIFLKATQPPVHYLLTSVFENVTAFWEEWPCPDLSQMPSFLGCLCLSLPWVCLVWNFTSCHAKTFSSFSFASPQPYQLCFCCTLHTTDGSHFLLEAFLFVLTAFWNVLSCLFDISSLWFSASLPTSLKTWSKVDWQHGEKYLEKFLSLGICRLLLQLLLLRIDMVLHLFYADISLAVLV